MSSVEGTGNAGSPEALAGRLFEAGLGMLDLMSVYLGDKLRLYEAMRAHGPLTPPELATHAGIDARYAVEWLEQQAATGLLAVDDVTMGQNERVYTLPHGHAEALLNRDSMYSMAPFARSMVAAAAVIPQLLTAFRTGGGVAWADYGADMIEAQGDFNRPWLTNMFGTELLPAIAAVHDRLVGTEVRVADVACGVGWAAIAVARAYPSVRVDGFDLDESSIGRARENAARAGVADRVTFEVRDAADERATGQYDVAIVVEAVHDLSRPVEVLAAIRGMLKPGGVALIADERTADTFSAPADDMERAFYGFSIFVCLPAAMTERPTAATGTVIRAGTLEEYARKAGFSTFQRLEEPALDMLRFYLLAP